MQDTFHHKDIGGRERHLMYDLLPFPNIVGATIEEQTAQINNYLIQLKETLEFVLTDISVENLSQELVTKLNELGADIEKSNEEREEQLNQVANKNITVSDVINSSAFEKALDSATPKKYLVSAEQVQTSDEPEGINIYAIEDANGQIKQFTVKNGKTPNVEFTVNFDTGNLEYTTS